MKASLARLDSYMVSYMEESREYCICGCELQLQENLFPGIIAGVTPIISQVKIWSSRESCCTVTDLSWYLLETIFPSFPGVLTDIPPSHLLLNLKGFFHISLVLKKSWPEMTQGKEKEIKELR